MEKCDITRDEKCDNSADTKSANLTTDSELADFSTNNNSVAATSRETTDQKGINEFICNFSLFIALAGSLNPVGPYLNITLPNICVRRREK